ncbi:UNVERIFIED_CONTAM: hypothetical protein K2H54_039388 [Gekko kuhli]
MWPKENSAEGNSVTQKTKLISPNSKKNLHSAEAHLASTTNHQTQSRTWFEKLRFQSRLLCDEILHKMLKTKSNKGLNKPNQNILIGPIFCVPFWSDGDLFPIPTSCG